MDDREILEHRYRFFAEKGVVFAFEQDKILVTLFTGIVAGLLALLVARDVGFWSALFFLTAVVGLGVCLLHMAFGAKVMTLLSALFGGEANVPNLVMREEPTQHALSKNRLFAQMCYAGQLLCLFWSVFMGAIGILFMLWRVVGWTGLAVALLFVACLVIAVFRPLVYIYRASRIALKVQQEEKNAARQ